MDDIGQKIVLKGIDNRLGCIQTYDEKTAT
jgi:hypothetical protein